MRTSTKITAGVAGTALVVAAAGAAYAYWTTSGAGDSAASAAATNGTLVLSADAVSDLTPGSTTAVPIKAANAGSTDLVVGTVNTVISSSDAGCQALITAGTAGLSFADVDTSGTTVLAGASGTVIGTGSLVWANSATVDQSACKSAGFTLTFTGV